MQGIFLLLAAVLLLPDIFAYRGHHNERREAVAVTPRGRILGSLFTSRLGKTIYGFRGIRYAKAPINELRFQPPQPPDEWHGSYNATQDGPACPQLDFEPVSEDCLFLNVYTTKLPTGCCNPKRPVIVYLHTGGFFISTGRSNVVGPEYLLDEDVVLVSFNYRLGMLGFISTGTKEAPGNLGLKDQVLALKWVKKNIIHFGGDPDSVTIYGYSAGATSLTLHMMSPMSTGLFHRGIAGSSSAFGTWPRRSNLLDLTKRHARLVNCSDNSVADMLNCLRTVPAETIIQVTPGLVEFGVDDPIITYEPVIEPDFGQERFVIKPPIQMALNGEYQKIPFMTGITKDEFGYSVLGFLLNGTLLKQVNDEFDRALPIILNFERNTQRSLRFTQTLRKFYFGDRPIDNSTEKEFTDMFIDDVGFTVDRAARFFSANNPENVYYYEFTYQGRYSDFYALGTTIPYGVVHQDDLIYLFYNSVRYPKFKQSDPESRTVDRMIKLWANFARTGNPIPEPTPLLDNISWIPFTQQNRKYMVIGEKLEMKTGLRQRRYQAWDDALPLTDVP